MDITIRCEQISDRSEVRAVNEAAFGTPDEADLIDRLRAEDVVLLSLVALQNSGVVGHIVFSRMFVQAEDHRVSTVSLAPLAVVPAQQRLGIGGRLIRAGLEMLRDQGENIVLVLGHADYYRRFGFSTEKAGPLESPFPPESYMAVELTPHALEGVAGRVVYPESFGL